MFIWSKFLSLAILTFFPTEKQTLLKIRLLIQVPNSWRSFALGHKCRSLVNSPEGSSQVPGAKAIIANLIDLFCY